MSRPHLAAQLAALSARLRLDPDNRLLRVEIAVTARRLSQIQAHATVLQPLPALLTQLAAGDVTTATVGAAISRDVALAGQVVQALDLTGAQTGDVAIGEVAGGSIYHIYLGGPRDDR